MSTQTWVNVSYHDGQKSAVAEWTGRGFAAIKRLEWTGSLEKQAGAPVPMYREWQVIHVRTGGLVASYATRRRAVEVAQKLDKLKGALVVKGKGTRLLFEAVTNA